MKDIRRILLIRFSSIGDIVLTTPLIRLLHKTFPTAEIDFVVRADFASLVQFNPYLHSLYVFPSAAEHEKRGNLRDLKKVLKTRRYDVVLDLHNSLRSRYIRWCLGEQTKVINKRVFRRFLLVCCKWNFYEEVVPVAQRYIETACELGVVDDGEGLELYIPEDVRKSLALHFPPNEGETKKIVGICPTAKHATKQWLPERFTELGIQLWKERGVDIALFGGAGDTQVCDVLASTINAGCKETVAKSYAGKFSLLETAAALERCDLVVTNDSGLMHVAAAMKRNIVAIFGPTVREFGFFPYRTTACVLERTGLPCRPCSHIGKEKCPKKHFRCMREIEVNDVFNACKELIDHR